MAQVDRYAHGGLEFETNAKSCDYSANVIPTYGYKTLLQLLCFYIDIPPRRKDFFMVSKLNETKFIPEYGIMETSHKLIGTCILSQQVFANAVGDAVEVLPTVFHVAENYIIIAMSNGEIQVFNLHDTRKEVLSSSPGAVWALAVRGDMLASGDTNNSIEIWDLAIGKLQQTLQGHTSTIRSLAILSDKKRIISASRDTTIRVWDVVEGKCTGVLTAHTGTVRTIALSSAEDLLLSGSHDGTACIWRITNDGTVWLQTLRGHEGSISCVAFVGDEDPHIVTAGMDASLRVWSLEDGKCLAILQGHSIVVNQMIVAGSKLITSDASGCICIWSVGDSLDLALRLETHRLSVVSLDSDGKTIVSGGKDRSVKLRDVESGQLLGQLGEVTTVTTVWKVGFLKDGRIALVVSRDGTVMIEIWHIN